LLTLWRHLLSILLLPFLVILVVPYFLFNTFTACDTRWGKGSLCSWLFWVVGAMLIISGLVLLSMCVSLFARIGKGTLAPWDPTRNLVTAGPYRFVRNPMIIGVALMLFGQTLLWGSWMVGSWACVFILINHIYFVLTEEPGLEKRFGESYRVYKANVPRWIPRVRPWAEK
jgi:protein-S-isoprenylcysteine O-methyltransferase Ste14